MKSFPTRILQIIAGVVVVVGILLLALGGILRPVIGIVMDPFVSAQHWLSDRVTSVVDFFTLPRDVTNLLQRNIALENEISSLQSQVIQLEGQLNEAKVLYALLDFARARPQNQYLASAVIGRDPSPFLHYIIIDHGSDDGIRYGMPVVTQQGLVGRVDAVTASASRVQLVTDPGSVINVRMQSLKREAQLTGSITGDVNLIGIPQDAVVAAGEILLTSGLGGNYPSDVLIGQVASVTKKENELFQTASVQPIVDFSSLRAVLIITNFKSIDISPLIPAPAP
jgi:rod shape-determining protein MreC